MLDAEADGVDRREVSRIVLRIDAEREPVGHGARPTVIWRGLSGLQASGTRNCSSAVGRLNVLDQRRDDQREFSCTRPLRLRPDDRKYARPYLFVVLLGDADLDLVRGWSVTA